MQKFAVHLYTQVRIKIAGIYAESVKQAVEKAEAQIDLHDLLDNKALRVSKYDIGNGATVEEVEWAEGCPDNYLVDLLLENGEVDYDKACWFGPDGLPLVDGKTTTERKAENADRAAAFMQELLDTVETLTGIADEHGPRTLADLMYLQQAILNGGFIDYYPGESHVLDIARGLPSGKDWAEFIKIEHMAQKQEDALVA